MYMYTLIFMYIPCKMDPMKCTDIHVLYNISRVRTGLFLVKLTETVVNLTKLSPMRTAGKVTKLSSIDHRMLVLPSRRGSFTGPFGSRKNYIVSFTMVLRYSKCLPQTKHRLSTVHVRVHTEELHEGMLTSTRGNFLQF
jgi:hypothetical protein